MLEEEDCPGTHPTFFIVTLEGLGEHRLDINTTHISDGGGIFLIRVPNTCNLEEEGTIFGGNDAGNCTACEMQHSRGKETCFLNSYCHTCDVCLAYLDPECSSVMMHTGTTNTAVATPSPSPPPESSDGNIQPSVIGMIISTTGAQNNYT